MAAFSSSIVLYLSESICYFNNYVSLSTHAPITNPKRWGGQLFNNILNILLFVSLQLLVNGIHLKIIISK